MAQFKVNKVIHTFSTWVADSVYFKRIGTGATGPEDDWFKLIVTDSIAGPRQLAVYVETDAVSGAEFEAATYTTGIIGKLLGQVGTAAGMGKGILIGSGLSLNAQGSEHVLSATGGGSMDDWDFSLETGVTANTFETQVAGGGFSTTDKTVSNGQTLDIRFADQTGKETLIASRNPGATSTDPSWRVIEAGSVLNGATTTQQGDINFEGFTQTEGGSVNSWLKVIATNENSNGTASWGKAWFLDPGYFTTSTATPTGASAADVITFNAGTVGWTVADDDADTDFIGLGDTLSFIPNATFTASVFGFNLVGAATATPDIELTAVDAGADAIVFWDESKGAGGGLDYLSPNKGITTSTTNLDVLPLNPSTDSGFTWTAVTTTAHSVDPATATKSWSIVEGSNINLDFDAASNAIRISATGTGSMSDWLISAEGGGTEIIGDGETVDFSTGTTVSNVFTFSRSTNNIRLDADTPGADRIVFWDQTGGGLAYASLGTNLSITGTTINGVNIWSTIAGDSGSGAAVTALDTLNIIGGAGVTTSFATDTLTISLSADYTSDWKESVRVATTAAGTLASSFENGDTIDGVVLVTGDRILIKNQASAGENGIYTVNASGAPTRAVDMDANDEISSGNTVSVEEGTDNADTIWQITTNGTINIGDAHTWTKVASTSAFFSVGYGMLDNTNEVTFAQPGGSTPVALGASYSGINYEQDAIKLAYDSAYFQINGTQELDMVARNGYSLFGVAGASAQPDDIILGNDEVVMRVGTGNVGGVTVDTSLEFVGHNASTLGAMAFSSDNFEWDSGTATQLNIKWTSAVW